MFILVTCNKATILTKVFSTNQKKSKFGFYLGELIKGEVGSELNIPNQLFHGHLVASDVLTHSFTCRFFPQSKITDIHMSVLSFFRLSSMVRMFFSCFLRFVTTQKEGFFSAASSSFIWVFASGFSSTFPSKAWYFQHALLNVECVSVQNDDPRHAQCKTASPDERLLWTKLDESIKVSLTDSDSPRPHGAVSGRLAEAATLHPRTDVGLSCHLYQVCKYICEAVLWASQMFAGAAQIRCRHLWCPLTSCLMPLFLTRTFISVGVVPPFTLESGLEAGVFTTIATALWLIAA